MGSHLVDSAIYRDMFGTERMRKVFDDEASVQRWLDVEAALARVEARLGIIPSAAAEEITRRATIANVNLEDLKRGTELVGYPILPIVHQLARACEGDAGEYVHWGATTQDIMDTAVVLQVRQALDILEEGLREVQRLLADLARRHRDTPMAGRTHGQHALPITFGYKVAIWLAEVSRHLTRLGEVRPRVLVGQFGGAVGTLASLGDRGLEVQRALVAELELGEPPIAWHVSRDGFAEVAGLLALIATTLERIATEIALLAKTETAEVAEPFVSGRGGSSTMPQKRNPIACEIIIAIGKTVRKHAALVLDAMVQDHERSTGPWQVEWLAIPEAFILTDGALGRTREVLAGLHVDVQRMGENLGLTRGLIVSEAVMMALAPHVGRQRAHDLVYEACRQAADRGRPLLAVLDESETVRRYLTSDELERLVDPANYLGLAREMVDRVLADLA